MIRARSIQRCQIPVKCTIHGNGTMAWLCVHDILITHIGVHPKAYPNDSSRVYSIIYIYNWNRADIPTFHVRSLLSIQKTHSLLGGFAVRSLHVLPSCSAACSCSAQPRDLPGLIGRMRSAPASRSRNWPIRGPGTIQTGSTVGKNSKSNTSLEILSLGSPKSWIFLTCFGDCPGFWKSLRCKAASVAEGPRWWTSGSET